MRRRALTALLLIVLATPAMALCAVCAPDACPMAAQPRTEDAGCHDMSHTAPAGGWTVEAVTPDCCMAAPPAREPATPATAPALDAPIQAPAQNAAQPPGPRPSATVASPGESPPPDLIRPLYTLHSSLLI